MEYKDVTPSMLLIHFLDFMRDDPPSGRSTYEVVQKEAYNVAGHATSIYTYKSNTKTYIWYNTPWESREDFTSASKREIRSHHP